MHVDHGHGGFLDGSFSSLTPRRLAAKHDNGQNTLGRIEVQAVPDLNGSSTARATVDRVCPFPVIPGFSRLAKSLSFAGGATSPIKRRSGIGSGYSRASQNRL
jgi:hypothetical protein